MDNAMSAGPGHVGILRARDHAAAVQASPGPSTASGHQAAPRACTFSSWRGVRTLVRSDPSCHRHSSPNGCGQYKRVERHEEKPNCSGRTLREEDRLDREPHLEYEQHDAGRCEEQRWPCSACTYRQQEIGRCAEDPNQRAEDQAASGVGEEGGRALSP